MFLLAACGGSPEAAPPGPSPVASSSTTTPPTSTMPPAPPPTSAPANKAPTTAPPAPAPTPPSTSSQPSPPPTPSVPAPATTKPVPSKMDGSKPTPNPAPQPTARPAPKPAPTPTPAPKPAYQVAETSGTFYAVQNANVRSGPGTQYGKVGGLTAGQAISVDGKSNGWYRFEGGKWVAGSLVSASKPQAPAPTKPPASPPKPADPPSSTSNVLWHDNVAGWLANPKSVPCGGLWKYTSENFYAREITCAGSARYHNLTVGQKISIGGRTCKMVGKQNLNYVTDDMGDVKWMGNVIVQTCYSSRNRGDVALINFSCD